MIGKKLSPVLLEIEYAILDYNAKIGGIPEYTDEAFRASAAIFMSVLMDKMHRLMENEKIALDIRCDMAKKAGDEFRKLIKTYTDFDTHEMYK